MKFLAPIGAGGMGEVYRAHDSRLGRDVAIKVLPSGFSADPERLRRFEQEARAAAALNHPNILAVHDIGQHDNSPYIVSELLQGETLRSRLGSTRVEGESPSAGREGAGAALSPGARGGGAPRVVGDVSPRPLKKDGEALPVRRAVEYAVQIAHGLAAAHERGITHRDLKPENVFITSDGLVKILDFGLAKLTQPEPAGPAKAGHYVHDGSVRLQADLSALSTTPPDTLPGVVLGTVGYMAPEQVRGQQADHRADIFAFGAILYEMLSGRRAFRGATSIDTLTAILKEDPADLPMTDRRIPPALERIVGRCLEKGPAARFQSTRDLAFALEGLTSHSDNAMAGASVPARKTSQRLAWVLAGTAGVIALLASSALAVVYLRRPAEEQRPITFLVEPPENTTFSTIREFLTVSPDGSRLAFVVREESGARLWVRSLDSFSAEPLAGTDGAYQHFLSPDSRFLAFYAGGKLKKVAVAGGPPQTLCDAAQIGGGGTWNREGVILFAPSFDRAIYQVSAGGGTPTPVTKLDQSRQEIAHLWPSFLADGKRFLYFARSVNPEQSGIYVKALDADAVRLVVRVSSSVAYVSPGYLVYGREGTLMAQPFDAARAETTGDPFPIADRLDQSPATGQAALAVSETGVLAYRSGITALTSRLIWRDRNGKELGTVGQPGTYRNPRLSPDATQIVVEMVDSSQNRDLWLADVAQSTFTRFTFESINEAAPVWAPDGSRIAFYVGSQLFQKVSSGAGKEELLTKASLGSAVTDDWTPDGKALVYHDGTAGTRATPAPALWFLPLDGPRNPKPIVESRFGTTHVRVSPDGRWIAYTSNESGQSQVYVQNFPTPVGKWQISTAGGMQPIWRRDGMELFYVAPDSRLMAVPIKLGARVEAGQPVPLFEAQMEGGGLPSGGIWHQYDVAPDGQRFLVNTLEENDAPPPVTVVVNWQSGLAARERR